jgi:hypothetical protein
MAHRHVALASLALVAALVAAVIVLTMRSKGDHSATELNRPATRQRAAALHPTPRLGLPSSRILEARSFTSSYPSGWHLSTIRGKLGFEEYQLSSTPAPITLGVPPAGAMAVTIGESPNSAKLAALFARYHIAHDPASELLRYFAATPPHAQGITRTLAPRTVSLGGVEAAEASYTYSYDGRAEVQSAVLARRGDQIVIMALVAEPAVARADQSGFALLTSRWHWR